MSERLASVVGERRSRRQRLVVAVSAVLVAAGGTAVAVRALLPAAEHSSAVPAEDAAATDGPRVVAEIPLPEGTHGGGVAVGAGSVWIGAPPQQGNGEHRVLRIDLRTNDVVAEVPVQGTPWRELVAASDDAVWVAAAWGPHRRTIERIDPDTNTVVATLTVPGGAVQAIAADRTALWALVILDPHDDDGMALLRIDPSTNEIVAEIPLGAYASEGQIRIGAGAVWVLGTTFEGEDTEHGGDLIRIDPSTDEVAARIPVGGFRMAVGPEEVWVQVAADGIFDQYGERWQWVRVDARTNEPSRPVELAEQGLAAVTPDALWAVDYDDREHVRVTRFDPQTLEVTARSEGIPSYFHDAAVDPASGTAWISTVHSIVRVDIA